MSDKTLSLEHIIRNIAQGNFTPSDEPKVSLEHAIRNVHEAVGNLGTDKYQGTQFKNVRMVTPHIKPDQHSQAAETASKMRSNVKEKGSMTLHGKVSESGTVPDQGDAATVAQWPATESGKKKIKEESEPTGTTERRKIKNVARPDDPDPKSEKSTLNKLGQIKTKIVDEEKVVPGLTPVILDPPLLTVSPDGDKVGSNKPQRDKLKKIVKEAMGAKALGVAGTAASAWDDFSDAYKQFKAGEYRKAINSAGVGVVRGAIYNNPVTGAVASAMEPTPASADDNEFARQQKYGNAPKPSQPQQSMKPQPVQPQHVGIQSKPFNPQPNHSSNISSSDYKIQKGDTLSAIAKKSGVSVSQLAKDNNIKDVNKIYSGSNLKINK